MAPTPRELVDLAHEREVDATRSRLSQVLAAIPVLTRDHREEVLGTYDHSVAWQVDIGERPFTARNLALQTAMAYLAGCLEVLL